MRISFSNLPILLLVAATTHANPLAKPTDSLDKRNNCNKANAALNVLKFLGPPATTLCSSYLHMPPAATTTTTIAPSVVTVVTSTVTIEAIQSVCPNPTKRDINAIEEDVGSIEKRVNLPALSKFGAAQLSCGCRCLNLTPKPTVTSTVTPSASTISVIATTTACVTCAPSGNPCEFERPDLCCGQTCVRVLPPIPAGPIATCL